MSPQDPYADLIPKRRADDQDPYADLAPKGAKPYRYGGGLPGMAAKGLTFGFSDELAGGVSALGALIPGGKSPGEAYRGTRDKVRAEQKATQESRPIASAIAELGGSAVAPLGALSKVLKTGTTLAKTAKGAATGAGLSAAYGIGAAEGDAGDQLASVASVPTAIGGIVGAVLPLVPAAARAFGDSRVRKAIETALTRTGTTMDDVNARVASSMASGKPITFAEALGPAAPEVLARMGPLGDEVAGVAFKAAEGLEKGPLKAGLARASRRMPPPVGEPSAIGKETLTSLIMRGATAIPRKVGQKIDERTIGELLRRIEPAADDASRATAKVAFPPGLPPGRGPITPPAPDEAVTPLLERGAVRQGPIPERGALLPGPRLTPPPTERLGLPPGTPGSPVIGRIVPPDEGTELLLRELAEQNVAKAAPQAPLTGFRDPIGPLGRGVGPKDTRPLKPRAMNPATPDDELLSTLQASVKQGSKPVAANPLESEANQRALAKFLADPKNLNEPGVLERLLELSLLKPKGGRPQVPNPFGNEAGRIGPLYHGSPHKFDKFDVSKIGTGEGAQAYGHGLYFAEAEDVARSYRDDLIQRPIRVLEGKPLTREQQSILKYFQERNVPIDDDAVLTVGDAMLADRTPKPRTQATWQKWKDAWEDLRPRLQQETKPGAVYKVELPKAQADDFLDWDKPLSQQSEKVRTALADAWLAHPEADVAKTGKRIYDNLWANFDAPDNSGRQNAMVSEALRKAGIRGIRYKDAGSRAAEGGTHNYVVFDDADINILDREGKAALQMMLGAGAAAGAGLTGAALRRDR